jgi:predicted heme/steroid binding protein
MILLPFVQKRLQQSRGIIRWAKVIITPMEPPDRIVSISELRRSTGERGTRMLVAYKGLVYDVTDCLRWKNGLHEGLHFPGQDLTAELRQAPHLEEVFKRSSVTMVGRLES